MYECTCAATGAQGGGQQNRVGFGTVPQRRYLRPCPLCLLLMNQIPPGTVLGVVWGDGKESLLGDQMCGVLDW